MTNAATPPGLWSVFQNRWVKLVFALLCVALAWALIYRLRGILVPFGLALVAAYVFDPVVGFLERRLYCSRVLVAVVFVLVLTAVFVAAIGVGVYYVVVTVEKVVPAAQRALAATAHPDGLWGRLQVALQSIPNELRVQVEKAIEELPTAIRSNFRELSGSLLLGVGAVVRAVVHVALASFSFVLFFVVTGYFLVALPRIQQAVKDLLPKRLKGDILFIVQQIDRDVRAFYRGMILDAAALGVIYGAGLAICGVDFGWLIGLAAGLLSVVPYLGLALGLPVALLLACVPYVGILKPLGVLATFAIGQAADGLLLTPKIIGRNVGLNPVAIILAILVFGELLGILGVIFAVPLAAVTRVLLAELVRYYKRTQES